LPNYLFAEFNTFYSFAPFFKKIFIVAPILIAFSIIYYKFFSPPQSQHFTYEKFDMPSNSFISGLTIFFSWFLVSVIFPSIYWGIYIFGRWKNVDWPKVADCWTFTIQISLCVAFISLIIGIAAISLRKIKVTFPVTILLIVYSLGNIAVAVSGILLFSNFDFLSGLNESIAPMLFSLCIMYVPITAALLLFLKNRINGNIFEASRMFIAKKSIRIKNISIPLLWPGITVILLMTLNFTGKDLDTSILMVPPGKSFLPVRMHLLLHYADYPSLAAVVLIYIFVIILTVFLIYFLAKTLLRYGIFKN